jgi:hypothetical protein
MCFDRSTWERIHSHRETNGRDGLVAWLHSHPRLQGENGSVSSALLAPSDQDFAIHAAFFSDPYLLCLILDPQEELFQKGVAVWGWDRYGLTLRQRTLHLYGG